MSDTHCYILEKHSESKLTLACSECGDLFTYDGADSATVVADAIRLHDGAHARRRAEARERHPSAGFKVTDEAIRTWLDGDGEGIWEPSFEERRGHVAVPLGHVAIDEAVARALAHDHDPAPPEAPVTLRIEDVHGRTSDHLVDSTGVGCIAKELRTDARVQRAWVVTKAGA